MEKKRTIKFIAFALAALMLFGVGVAAWATKCFGAFESKTVQQEPGAGGMVLGECEGKGIRLTGAVIARADYAANEVSPLAETAYTVTVTPTPADAHDTYAWTSTDDESVKLTPSNGGKTCKVECLKAFAAQITLTCTSENNPDITARLTVDYVKRISSVNVSLSPASVAFGSTETSYTVTATPVWGTGTIQPENFTVTGGTLSNNLAGLTMTVNKSVPLNSTTTRVYTLRGIEGDFTFTGTTFKLTTPYDAFIVDTELTHGDQVIATNFRLTGARAMGAKTSVVPLAAPGFGAPTVSQLKSAYNNSVLAKAPETTKDGTLTINYTYSYGDIISESKTASTEVEFDVSGLVVNATDITLSDDKLIF